MADETDETRALALLALTGSLPRDLLAEVAKVEHGMARHLLRTQTIVLRYVKALLALLTTALATFAAGAVVEPSRHSAEATWSGSQPSCSYGRPPWCSR